jgi:hypothetical protein
MAIRKFDVVSDIFSSHLQTFLLGRRANYLILFSFKACRIISGEGEAEKCTFNPRPAMREASLTF